MATRLKKGGKEKNDNEHRISENESSDEDSGEKGGSLGIYG